MDVSKTQQSAQIKEQKATKGPGNANGTKAPDSMQRAVTRELGIANNEALAQAQGLVATTAATVLAAGGDATSALQQKSVELFSGLANQFLRTPPSGPMSEQFQLPANLQQPADLSLAFNAALGAPTSGDAPATAGTRQIAQSATSAQVGATDATQPEAQVVTTNTRADISAILDGKWSVDLKQYSNMINSPPPPGSPGAMLLASNVAQAALRQVASELRPQSGPGSAARQVSGQAQNAASRLVSEAKKFGFSLSADADIESLVFLLFMQIKRDSDQDLRELIKESKATLDQKKELREKKAYLRDLVSDLKTQVDNEWEVANKTGQTTMSKEEYRAWRQFDFRETGDPAKPYEAVPCAGPDSVLGSGEKMVSTRQTSGVVIEAPSYDEYVAGLASKYGLSSGDIKQMHTWYQAEGPRYGDGPFEQFERWLGDIGMSDDPSKAGTNQIALSKWQIQQGVDDVDGVNGPFEKLQMSQAYGLDKNELEKLFSAFQKTATKPESRAEFQQWLGKEGFQQLPKNKDQKKTVEAANEKLFSEWEKKQTTFEVSPAVLSLFAAMNEPAKEIDFAGNLGFLLGAPEPSVPGPEAAGEPPAAPPPELPEQMGAAGMRQVSLDELQNEIKSIEDAADSLNEFGELQQMRLQKGQESNSQAMSMLSNFLKKASESASGIISNLK